MRPVFICIAALLLCYMGFYNGFPIVDSDTGAYIFSGFTNTVKEDRPIIYGLFLRHISLAESLWLVIFVQSLILSYSLYLFFRYFAKTQQFTLYFMGFLLTIILFTGASVTVSQLMPDVFTSVLMLLFMVLFFGENVSRRHQVIAGILFLLAMGVHNSHYAIIGLFLIVATIIALVCKIRKKTAFISWKKLGMAWSFLVAAWLLVCTVHASLGSKFALSRGTHVFTMSRLIDMGIINPYLDEVCATKNYKLCPYKDNFPWDFIWDYEHSPLYKTGGWLDNEEEFNAIIGDVLTRPKYLKQYLIRSFEASIEQFFTFTVGPNNPLLEGSSPHISINRFYHNQVKEFFATKQAVGILKYDWLNNLQAVFILVCLFIYVILLYSGVLDKNTRIMLWVLLALVFANAFVCGALSGVVARYQARVIWLVALPLVICFTEKGLLRKVLNSYTSRT